MSGLTISQLKKKGFEGVDQSLEISLNEYRLIWKIYKKNVGHSIRRGDICFLYYVNKTDIRSFWLNLDTDIKNEYNWINWKNIFDFTGIEEKEYFKQSIPIIMSNLIDYYGIENFSSGF